MSEINNRLGYRFLLVGTNFNERVRPGGILNLRVDINNIGFASLVNRHAFYIVLDGKQRYVVPLDMDVRQWEPGTVTVNAKLHVPSNINQGEHKLALWLPDGSESLRDNPLYAIQFANENVWDESTGWNVLGTVTVSRDAGGSYQSGREFEVIESSFLVQRGVLQVLPGTVTSPELAAAGSLISNQDISNDAENIFLSFDYASGEYNAFQLYVDADQNPETGFTINGIGAEALFENHTWNIYDGSGNDWKWQPTEVLIRFDDTGTHVKWTISRSILRSSRFDIVFQLMDPNWNTAFTTDKTTYVVH